MLVDGFRACIPRFQGMIVREIELGYLLSCPVQEATGPSGAGGCVQPAKGCSKLTERKRGCEDTEAKSLSRVGKTHGFGLGAGVGLTTLALGLSFAAWSSAVFFSSDAFAVISASAVTNVPAP